MCTAFFRDWILQRVSSIRHRGAPTALRNAILQLAGRYPLAAADGLLLPLLRGDLAATNSAATPACPLLLGEVSLEVDVVESLAVVPAFAARVLRCVHCACCWRPSCACAPVRRARWSALQRHAYLPPHTRGALLPVPRPSEARIGHADDGRWKILRCLIEAAASMPMPSPHPINGLVREVERHAVVASASVEYCMLLLRCVQSYGGHLDATSVALLQAAIDHNRSAIRHMALNAIRRRVP